MKKNSDFQILSEIELTTIEGGNINWGSVAGHCIGGAILTGAFSPAFLVGAGIGCGLGAGQAIINGL